MRIHTNTLTERDIYEACRKAGVSAPVFNRHGSRSHDHAFEIQLSGSSPYRSQGHGHHAATWDEWGVFFALLFTKDPGAMAGNKSWGYRDSGDFHYKTARRFLNGMPDDTHPRHKWRADGTGEGMYCERCTASLRWK